jgi:hypothetical protein
VRRGAVDPSQPSSVTERSMLSMLAKAGLIFVTGHIVFLTLALFLAS